MNFTQNEKINQVTEKSIVVGVDIASEVHYARAFDWRGVELAKVFRFENSLEGFEAFTEWIEVVKRDNGKDRVLVGAEPTGHYWFGLGSYLKEEDIKLVIEGRYSEPYMPEGIYADMRVLVSSRMRLVKEMNSIKNRIARWFKIYFPEHADVYGSFDSVSSMMVMKVAPMPEDIVELGSDAINELWRREKLRAVGMKRAIRLVEAAKRSIGCKEGSRAARFEIRMLLEDYECKSNQYNEVMELIEELCIEIPEVKELLEIKGIGLATVSGFLAEVGEVRRFKSPKQIQKLAGLALRESSSGKQKGQTRISKRGRRRLRAILFQGVVPLRGTPRYV